MSSVVVVPVKAFAAAKARLAPVLDPAARAGLAEQVATTVVLAAAPLPVVVACDDREVASWATQLGASIAWTPGLDLNAAVQIAVDQLVGSEPTRAIVVHADLPHARSLGWLADAEAGEVVVVPDRHGDGTNALSVPRGVGFTFAYGPGSAARHVAEAGRLGLAARSVIDPDLALDLDTPADLELAGPLAVAPPGR